MVVTCCSELESYRSHLTRAPRSSAADTSRDNLVPAQQNLPRDLQAEGSLVRRNEGKLESADLLHSLCPYVLHQSQRDIMSTLSAANFILGFEEQMIAAWYPALSQSSNVEDVFKACEEAVLRTKIGDTPQRAQYPLIKEYTLNHNIKAPIV